MHYGPSFSNVPCPYVMKIYWKQNSRKEGKSDMLLHSHKSDILSKARYNFLLFLNKFIFPVIINLVYLIMLIFGPGNSVGIATGYELDVPGIESRWGSRFSALVQTGPGAQSASCTMGTRSFLGVKSGRGVTLTPHSL